MRSESTPVHGHLLTMEDGHRFAVSPCGWSELVEAPFVVRLLDAGDATIRNQAPARAYPDHLVRFRGSPLPPSDRSCFLLVQLDSALYICRTATWVGPSDVGAALE